MPDYTDRDAKQASSIIERLLDRERLDRERRLDGLPKGFSVVDVEAHAEEFLGALELLRWIDTEGRDPARYRPLLDYAALSIATQSDRATVRVCVCAVCGANLSRHVGLQQSTWGSASPKSHCAMKSIY
jgi:hypothetical protein